MIDEKFYKGFEEEPNVSIYYINSNNEEEGMRVWIGYFETLLNSCFNGEYFEGGILKEYSNLEGWYEDSPWEIRSIKNTVEELKQFDLKNTEDESPLINRELSELKDQLIEFLQEANNGGYSVFINYE